MHSIEFLKRIKRNFSDSEFQYVTELFQSFTDMKREVKLLRRVMEIQDSIILEIKRDLDNIKKKKLAPKKVSKKTDAK